MQIFYGINPWTRRLQKKLKNKLGRRVRIGWLNMLQTLLPQLRNQFKRY
jgi:hypothetical protein